MRVIPVLHVFVAGGRMADRETLLALRIPVASRTEELAYPWRRDDLTRPSYVPGRWSLRDR